jgi:iron complex transport system substrate-binding protein
MESSASKILATMTNKKIPRIRIVSLAPNVTSTLLELGAGRDLVGVSKWCKDVADVGRRPQVGDCWKMDIDEVMRLKPTILIGSVPFAPDTVAKLLAQPVTFVAINPRTLADIERDISTLGSIANRAASAQKLIRKMRHEFENVARAGQSRLSSALRQSATLNGFRQGTASAVPKSRSRSGVSTPELRPRVYCEAWPKPRISSPPWVAELVEIAGGKMVVASGQRVTDEDVAAANPEIIVLAWAAAGSRSKRTSALQNPAWRDVLAIKNRRVFVIRDELLNTPGPPLIKGAWELLQIIHSAPRKGPE